MDYTHRDRRAQRTVTRAFVSVVGGTAGLIGLALVVPVDVAGLAGVLALAGLGAAYVGWSERLVAKYAEDLRAGAEGSAGAGLLRVEMHTRVGLEREVVRPTARSPHARRRSPGSSGVSRQSRADEKRNQP